MGNHDRGIRVSYKISYVLVGIIFLLNSALGAGPREQLLQADELDDIGEKLAIYGQLCECKHTSVRIDAALRLAWIYQYGYFDVIPRDTAMAVSYWTVLAQQQINRSIKVQAYEMLGDCYWGGWKGNPPDFQKAESYFKRAKNECSEADLDIKDRVIEKLKMLKKED